MLWTWGRSLAVVDASAIALQRLRNLHLWGPPVQSPEGVVRQLGAMQSQEFAYAKWSVGQRARDPSVAGVDHALAAGSILRTHVLRPTWHFVAAEDIHWILELTAPRVHGMNRHYYRKLGMDDPLIERSHRLLASALEGGRHLTRPELASVLADDGIAVSGVTLAYVLIRAELDAVICSGAMRGRQHTYALLAERAPHAKRMDRDTSLAELTRRYFSTRGPATVKDYVTWCSMTMTEGRRGLELLGTELRSRVVDGRTYWFTEPPMLASPRSPTVDLVQGYDEYVMSYSESRDVLLPPGRATFWPANRPSFYHAILLDGRLIGHWRHAVGKDLVTVEAKLDRPLRGDERESLHQAVERYGRFLGLPAVVRG
jgi:hypothetical protein